MNMQYLKVYDCTWFCAQSFLIQRKEAMSLPCTNCEVIYQVALVKALQSVIWELETWLYLQQYKVEIKSSQ